MFEDKERMMVVSGTSGEGRHNGDTGRVGGGRRVMLGPHFPESILFSRKSCREPGFLSAYMCISKHHAGDGKGN